MALLSGKRALITGATGVIGKAIALAFAQEGCELVLSGRSETKLKEVEQEFKDNGLAVQIARADVEDEEQIENLMSAPAVKKGLDVLALAHGAYGYIGAIESAAAEEWLSAVKVNLYGTFLCVKYGLPVFKKAAIAKIITFAGGGEGPLPNFSAYVASKAAILRLTETLAAELKDKNIEINAISPGAVNSGLNKGIIAVGEKRAGQKMYEQALKQMSGEEGVSADKAAALAVFLASPESDGLSGKNLSAVWDNWQDIPKHLSELQNSDVFTMRRIKPKDRGYDW